MAVKLFTIGDSISQGFMSGAAARTDLCYSTLLAETLNVQDYRFHDWPGKYRFKYDLETILRSLEKKFGTDIRLLEWVGALGTINKVFDTSEDYFERGEGAMGKSLNLPFDGYHNVAVEGMDVGDAWMVTPAKCLKKVEKSKKKDKKDGYFKVASEPFSRNAFRILNPNAKKEYMNYSAVSWLKHYAEDEGVENLLLFLGANNALGTVLSLEIKQTSGDQSIVLDENREKRAKKNLWHPRDFETEYGLLLQKIMAAMAGNREPEWNCFVGTIPLVTIAPVIKGFGEARIIKDPGGTDRTFRYYQYYCYFPLSPEAALKSERYLKFRDALFIDKSIIQFNLIIRKLIDKANASLGRTAFHIVDISESLTQMAWKRNSGEPIYDYPDYFQWLYPPVDTKYYHANDKGELEKGGVFSLDGIHPSALGQGLVAWEFLKKMQKTGVAGKGAEIDWERIQGRDTLREKPIRLMKEVYQHDKLMKFFVDIYQLISLKD